ncbi:MAG TPA: TonB-dependent receptor [Candidatus Desulfaltia sp.]|nr:TonB-dependent receptor [Candidatus Desulfaltia sp.]
MSVSKKVFIVLVGILLAAAHLPAQAPTSKLFGTVTDEQGTPLPGVTVEAASPKLVGKGTAISDENGVYRVFALTPGIYKVTFVLQGFKTVVRDGIIVEVEQSVKLNVAMPLGAIEEEVTVVGQSPLIDVKSTVKGMTMTKDVFEMLPRGRDFDTLVAAVPGVQNEPMLSGISVDGASGSENMFYVDGTDITNIYYGVRGQGVAFEFVDEVQVKASGYDAEYGGSLGGVIHVITRQGGNAFHGDVVAYYSGSGLNGKERDSLRWALYDPLVSEYVNYQDLYGKDKVDRLEAGFNLGGYVIKDRLWFYGSFLPVYLTSKRHVEFEPSLIEGDYTRRDTFWNFQAKLTSQPFKFVRLGASFVSNLNNYKGDLPPRAGTGNPTDPWRDYGYRYPYWTAAAYADFTFGNNLLFSIRGGSFYNNTTDQLVQPHEPYYGHGGTGNSVFPDIPSQYIRPRGWSNMPAYAISVTEKMVAQRSYAGGDLTYYLNFAGEHAWKFGAQWVRTAEDWKAGPKYPDYPIISLAWGRPFIYLGQNYGQGTYGCYGVFGNETTGPSRGFFYKVHSDRWALYLQDSWTIKGRLTLNLGLRTESEYIPNYSNNPALKGLKPIDFKFGDKLAPRLGFVYDIFGDANLKIFGSYGLYFDVMKLYIAATAYGGWRNVAAYYTLDTYEWDKIGENGYYPGTLLRVVDYLSGNWTVDPSLKPMSQQEISFGMEKKLLENVSATVRLVQKHLRYAIEDVGVISGGDITYYMANPGYGYSRSTADGGKFDAKYPACPEAKREYWGLNFSLDKRLSDRWLGGFSYTWSRLTGNYSGLASSDEVTWAGARNSPNAEINFDTWFNAYDKNLNPIDGPLATDRPHVFKLYGAYTFPFRLTVGALVNAMSGTPVTEYWDIYDNYMPYNRGNLGRTPFLWFANLYAEYSLRLGKTSLSFNVNIDNVFNVATTVGYYPYSARYTLEVTEDQILSKDWELETTPGYVPASAFMKPAGFYPPIAARVGVRFSF